MEFYNPSDKIKQMRKKFRVNQAELEGINMTRAFISMMESGKRSVSKASSKRLVERFKEIADRISVKLDIDDEYFYRQPEEDARYYCQNELKDEEKLNHKKLEELIEIEKRFNLDDLLADTYKINGRIYLNEKDYSKAFIDLNNALGKYKELRMYKQQPQVYNSLGYCKIMRSDYEEAVFFYSQGSCYAMEVDDQLAYFKANHSLAVAYGHMKEYDKCLKIIEENILVNKDKAYEVYINNAKLMRGNVFLETGKLDEAIKEYLELVDIVRNKDEVVLGLLYQSIADYYYEVEDYKNSLHYISEAQRIKIKINKEALPSTLGGKGKILFKQGIYDESIMLFELAIDMAEEYKNFHTLVELYRELVKVLEYKNDYNTIKEKMNRLRMTLEDNGKQDGQGYVIYKLAQVAAIEGERNESLELLNKLEEFV
ncbi:hypothetical protein CSC2_26000 [Clostridium zeae]|uniref:HTH cro/C1-type domain-containing protein n=1 Tax=Clostridium zeae TaxID=2759022 RepID=A0ABQ1EB81_9CLOT|nr:hypothetical protein [Clostridium zeae]GFZ32074.1 hypothetical protein CSC2_26000 [Clostridium zeae]